jgi:hypothetical protein
MTSAWQQYKKNLGDTRPWDMLNPNEQQASEELATERYSTCLGCPELISLTKQCKKCGCFMAAKTKLEKATCPLGKW